MAWGSFIKTEHNGAKNGGGFWGKREFAKAASRKRRRANDKKTVREYDGSE